MLTIYTTQTCAYCVMVKKYLTSKNVEYKIEDVTDNEAMREKLFEKTGLTTVPVTTDGTTYITGFQPALLAQLI